MRTPRCKHERERGAALVCALVLMLAVMLIGISASRAVFASIASSSAGRERSLAYAAAEAALRDAERDIAGAFAGADPARTAQFTAAGAGGFVDGCGHGGSGLGLCLATSPPAWQLQDLADPDNAAVVPYGHYTGARLATGSGLLPARPPAYLIEKIAPPGAAASLGHFYRVTAIGFGSHAPAQVVLQAVVRLPPAVPVTPITSAAPPATAGPLPAGRISWREIANWPRLHAQATE